MVTGYCQLVVDTDTPENERLVLQAIQNGNLPQTRTIKTARGNHRYYSTPENLKSATYQGIEIKALGSYVVVPPSIHPDGPTYTVIDYSPIAPCPAWLIEEIQKENKPPLPPVFNGNRPPATDHEKAYALKTLKMCCEDFTRIPVGKGKRNAALNQLTYTVGGMIAAGWLDQSEAAIEVSKATADYLTEKPYQQKTVYSGLNAGYLKPQAPLPIVEEIPNIRTVFSNPFIKQEQEITFVNNIESEPLDWLWQNMIARKKLTLIGGESFAGKSTVTLDIACTVSNGGDWPDGTKCKPGYVLIWTCEDGIEDTAVPRIRAMSGCENRIAIVKGKPDPTTGKILSFNPSTDMPWLIDAAKRLLPEPPSLLIIDPAVATVAKGKDANQSNIVREGLRPVTEFAEQLNCAVLGITHLKKDSVSQNLLDRFISSMAWIAVARSVLVVVEHKITGMRLLVQAAVNLGRGDIGGWQFTIQEEKMLNRKGELIMVEDSKNPGAMVPATSTKIEWGGHIKGKAQKLVDDYEQPEKIATASQKALSLMATKTLLTGLLPMVGSWRFSIEMDLATANVAPSVLKKAMVLLSITKQKTKETPSKGIWKRNEPVTNIVEFPGNEETD
jgi:hypothetical protein